MSRAILELNNFVYDINAHAFVKLNDLYNTENQKFQNLLHEKLKIHVMSVLKICKITI